MKCERCGEVNPAEIHTCTPMVRITTPEDIAKIKSKWVGLTDEEIKDILDCGRPNLVNIKKAEQKLKEKNT